MEGCNFHALYFVSCKAFLTNLAPSPCKAVPCILRLARLCIASLTPCALQGCALHLAPCKTAPCRLAPCALQGCALQACKPCTLQALKALFWGGSYFTLLKSDPIFFLQSFFTENDLKVTLFFFQSFFTKK